MTEQGYEAEKKAIRKAILDYYSKGHDTCDPALYEEILHPEWQILGKSQKTLPQAMGLSETARNFEATTFRAFPYAIPAQAPGLHAVRRGGRANDRGSVGILLMV